MRPRNRLIRRRPPRLAIWGGRPRDYSPGSSEDLAIQELLEARERRRRRARAQALAFQRLAVTIGVSTAQATEALNRVGRRLSETLERAQRAGDLERARRSRRGLAAPPASPRRRPEPRDRPHGIDEDPQA